MELTTWATAGGIAVAFLITAALLRAAVPGASGRIRRMAFFCLTYLIAVSLVQLSNHFGWTQTASVADKTANLAGWLTLLEIFSILLFKLALPRIGYNPPSIISELFLGVAIIVLIVLTLRNFGVDATGIAATSAVVTGILAIGLQATLGNVIGGIALQLDRSIRVGDWIQLENGRQGKVQEIRWRHTVIETRDWDTIIVPNSSLLAANIIILGKREGQPLQHRMWVYFSVDFRTRPAHVIETAEKALQALPPIPGIASEPKPNCVCVDFSSDNRESYALYAVRYWLVTIQDDDPTNSLVRRRLYAALQRANIPLAIPAAQLFLDSDNSERRERKDQEHTQRRLGALKQIEFLRVLNPQEHAVLAKGLQPVLYSKGENIMVQNDQADWLYILTEGCAEVWVGAGDKNSKVSDLYAPTFFGEMGLMTGAPRSATIVATSDVYCYRLYRDGFQKILQQRPAMAEEISAILATREVEMQSIRDKLDDDSRNQRIDEVSVHMLSKISSFFGLTE